MNAFSRTELLFGTAAMERLAQARVAVFGIGGVGGYTVEALARSGVGALDLIDNDTVCTSNLNRQIIATRATIGMAKVDAAEERIRLLYPECRVTKIDTVSGKLGLVEQAYAAGTPIISAMGAGNKLDPTAFEVADIMQTSVCPLARVMRRELKKRGIPKLKVVYSKELPAALQRTEWTEKGKPVPGSCAFVPSVAGLILAGEVIKDLTGLQAHF